MRDQDILMNALEHSWGKSPKQKAREKECNAEYYRKNKEKWAKYAENARNNQSQMSKNVEGAQAEDQR